jgi:hypothetical protein
MRPARGFVHIVTRLQILPRITSTGGSIAGFRFAAFAADLQPGFALRLNGPP